ncbi:myoneurin-like [Polypterus senegalus]|uniref:myoneurin-like n=1 Tax=Polypterus senegalus TaxID=55291 RepID=UPI0019622C8A|nr:myoneurin-like [Polypterus senegalus]
MQNFHHSKYLLDQLNKQREQSILCDCIVVIGQSHFKAHKNVLAAFSEYFGAQNDSSSIDGFTFLDPSQVNEYKFQTLLDFLYTGVINIDCYNVTELLRAAKYLKIDGLVARCKEFYKRHIANKQYKMEVEAIATASVGPVQDDQSTCDPFTLDFSNKSTFLHAGDNHKSKTPSKTECVYGFQKTQAKRNNQVQKPAEHNSKTHSKTECANGFQKTKAKKIKPVQKLTEKAVSNFVNDNETNEQMEDLPVLTEQKEQLTRVTEASSCSNHNRTGLKRRQKEFKSESVDNTSVPSQGVISQNPKRRRSRSGKKRALKSASASAPVAVKRERCLDPSLEIELSERQSKRKPLCSACGKVFSETSSLQRHMRIHKGEKPYICQLCGKAFTQCNQLKTHTRTHTGEKPYKCDICNKGFAQKCQLVFHSHMHHGEEKPYKCDFCSLQFATSSNLKIHTRIHSGEKPYVCERCGQSFTQASTLTYHLRRHTGEKPYVCDMCGKAFAVSSSLITHTRQHTGEKPYTCATCGKNFFSSGVLKKHIRSHKGDLNTPYSPADIFYDEDILQKAVLQELAELAELKPVNIPPSNFTPVAPEVKMLLMTEGACFNSDQSVMSSGSNSNFIFTEQGCHKTPAVSNQMHL